MKLRAIGIAAGCALAAFFAPVSAAPIPIDVAVYERTTENDDVELSLDYKAIYACEYGDHYNAFAAPAIGCVIAYENTFALSRYDDALRHSVAGCEKYGNAAACRAASRLPVHMGNMSLRVPARYVAELKRLAAVVCHSNKPVTNDFAGDVKGRECAAFARHFVLARDLEYKYALQPTARAYVEMAFNPRLAVDLAAASCKRWSDTSGCEQLRIASRLSEGKQAARSNRSNDVAAAAQALSAGANAPR